MTNKPVGSTVVIAGGIANFSSQSAGTCDFTYTLTNSMAGCPMTAVTTVTIMSAPVATLKTVEQACNSNFSPDYVNEVDFDTLVVSGVTGGVWTYQVRAAIQEVHHLVQRTLMELLGYV
ncbi:MAG: hypothetical protein IPM04_09310 [Saprospiraceae bacterium]|nr:hypothetical protein [Candidatus Brachybacter algidus]MBK8748053.1 hypothetical protein [Candidatus Brachybacter algidus]